MKRFLRLFVVTLIALLGLSGGMLCEEFAEHQTKVYASTPITLNGVFGDNMILQRNKQVKIWGYGGTVGEEVKVSFNGQTKTAVITSEGWEVYLDPMEGTFEEQSIVVTSGTQSLVVNNVCVGEVVDDLVLYAKYSELKSCNSSLGCTPVLSLALVSSIAMLLRKKRNED